MKRPRGHDYNNKNSEQKPYHNEITDPDDDTKNGKFNPDKTPPPLPGSKPSKAKGPDTPSPPIGKRAKYSESTPDSTPPSKQRGEPAVTGQKGVKRCLSDLIETEGKRYIRKLKKAARLSKSKIDNAEELARNGATLSKQGETIQELGKQLISTSKDRFDEYVKSLTRPSSTDLN